MKRIFTFFFALLSTCTFSAYAAIVEGTCGDNLTWTLNTEDSTLVVSGTGEMYNYQSWEDYTSYIKYVTLPDGLTSIGDGAFYWCSGLTSVTIPNSVTRIGDMAFVGCDGLSSPVYTADCFAYLPTSYQGAYTIPEGIKQIVGGAFDDCSRLTSVTIPSSVTNIENGVFLYIQKLKKITCYAPIPPLVGQVNKYPISYTLYVPAEYVDTYRQTEWWKAFKSIRAIK